MVSKKFAEETKLVCPITSHWESFSSSEHLHMYIMASYIGQYDFKIKVFNIGVGMYVTNWLSQLYWTTTPMQLIV